MRIGDKIKGIYFGSPFIGVVSGGDMSGNITVDFLAPAAFMGRKDDMRDGAFIFGNSPEYATIVVTEEQAIPCDESVVIEGHIVRVR